ncbi:E3 ubiquitin-protein ligase DTX3L [Apteryx rowi]|uniref:E3 ubiquitin-protein ligase DTX3L n=1 Tax=Apteryx rowi TaxID=308060 RepID=UPI000E1CB222|nr:E3 ubiquitin-protein ligase DTX3L [Apteryx rowi]
MAAAPLLVRLSPAPGPDASDKLRLKLESYFQSGRRSGGGECEVRAGPEPGTYRVQFKQEQDRRSVQARGEHVLEVGGTSLKVILEAEEGERSHRQRAAPAAAPRFSPPPPMPGEQQAAEGYAGSAADAVTRKIFLTVSATLNTSMFTEQQRENITMICPNLRRERNPGIDGSETLTGDYTDIEKVYHYFKDLIAGNDQCHDFSHSESKSEVGGENGLNTEEMLQVPSALYEYFCHACKEQIKELCERLGVSIKSKDGDSGNTSVSLISDTSPTSIQAAKELFIRTFQKSVGNLEQEKIPLTNSNQLNETIMKLNALFSNLLAKQEGNQLLLRGPKNEILAAKKFLAEESGNSQAEKNMNISSELYKYRNGIEVDASEFKLLEAILSKEIEDIKQNFDTVVEKKDSSHGQKMVIIFRPRFKIFDMSSHATESFINAFQNASAMLREKVISWKLSEDHKKRLNMLLDGKQLENLHIKLKKKGDKFVLSGLPNHLHAAEKHIMSLLDTEDFAQAKNRTALASDLSHQEASSVSEMKYSSRQKNNFSSKQQAKPKTEDEEQEKDVCPICMDSFKNKEVLTKCKHAFCKSCIQQAMSYKRACPICNTCYGLVQGDQPDGTMSVRTILTELPGYPRCNTIEITYVMYGGIQTSNHPNPGKFYHGTSRKAYLPDNKEGQEILQLLRRAFDQKLIFTVGQSRTTGAQGVITWNDIHHKTQMDGGPTSFGYPDPDYLQRVRSELKARGIE